MTRSHLPAILSLALASLPGLGVSCSVFDEQGCSTADDCEPTGDNRYVPVCELDDVTLDPRQVNKMCGVELKPSVGCNPDWYTNPEHPFKVASEELGDSLNYIPCDPATQYGMQGCPPSGDTCNEGLAVNEVGLCDDDDPDTPMAVQATTDFIGLDVRDQFCRSFFCDDRFVCDPGTSYCVLCDPDEAYGEGGCGEIWIAGVRSCVYDVECEDNPNVTDEDVTFGCG